ATNDLALMELRRRKGRAEKPFAIMARDLASAFLVAHISAEEIKLLTSPERPIVLLKKRAGSRLSTLVAPGNPNIGVMLPYSPLHHLLFAPDPAVAKVEPVHWLVMTSANASEEPIIFDNNVAADQLGGLADALLLHNRSIHVPCDDSVVR